MEFHTPRPYEKKAVGKAAEYHLIRSVFLHAWY